MNKSSVYSGMVNMRKLTMFNPAAFAGSSSGDERIGKEDAGSVRSERRRRNERRNDNRRSAES